MRPQKIGLYIHELLYNRGGTEAYTVRMAAALAQLFPGADITFVSERYAPADFQGDAAFCRLMEERYGISFDSRRVHLVPVRAGAAGRLGRFLSRQRLSAASRPFDLFFYCSRGYLTFRAKANVAIIHFPMPPLPSGKSGSLPARLFHAARNRAFVRSYDAFLPNSEFTRGHLEQYWPGIPRDRIFLLYPPIVPVPRLNLPKEHLILVCSRIDASKKLELLIDAYRSSPYLHENYRMVIAGNNASDTVDYWEKIRAYTASGDVELCPNIPWEEMVLLYNRAELFWHCKGFGEDDPYMMEHFGMTTVEAMGAGCVPVVIGRGGQREIVSGGCGFLWDDVGELVRRSEELAKDGKELARMSEAARQRAAFFYTDAFRERLGTILERVLGGEA